MRKWWYKVSTRVVTCTISTLVDTKRLFEKLENNPIPGIILPESKFKNAKYFTVIGVIENGETRKVSFRLYKSKKILNHTGIHITGISLLETFDTISRSIINYLTEYAPECFSTLDFDYGPTQENMTNIQSIVCNEQIDLESLHTRLVNKGVSLKPLGTKNASSIIIDDGLSCTVYKFGSVSFKLKSESQLPRAEELYYIIQECCEDITTKCVPRIKPVKKYEFIDFKGSYVLIPMI